MTDISMTTIWYNLEVAQTKGSLIVIGPINTTSYTLNSFLSYIPSKKWKY